jgi:activator of HSP90 ATPase
MAKWGEGDPRWLVEHREDGKNVNNWHWTATTKMTWVKERLGELFNGIASPLPNDKGMLTITGLKEVNGEATITLRKGNKKLVIYDLNMSLAYEGQLSGSDQTVKGEVKVEDVSNGSEEDEYIFTITVEGTGSEQDECKKGAESLRPLIIENIRQLIADLNKL